MKVSQLYEMAIAVGGAQKVNKLKKFLTPEVLAKNYDMFITVLAGAMSSRDMDELEAKLKGTDRNSDDIESSVELIARMMPKETNPQVDSLNNEYNNTVVGWLPPFDVQMKIVDQAGNVTGTRKSEKNILYYIQFEKQKWVVSIRERDTYGDLAKKKFDDESAAVEWALKQIKIWPEKLRKMYEGN